MRPNEVGVAIVSPLRVSLLISTLIYYSAKFTVEPAGPRYDYGTCKVTVYDDNGYQLAVGCGEIPAIVEATG